MCRQPSRVILTLSSISPSRNVSYGGREFGTQTLYLLWKYPNIFGGRYHNRFVWRYPSRVLWRYPNILVWIPTDLCGDIPIDLCGDVPTDLCGYIPTDLCGDIATHMCVEISQQICVEISQQIFCADIHTDWCEYIYKEIFANISKHIVQRCPKIYVTVYWKKCVWRYQNILAIDVSKHICCGDIQTYMCEEPRHSKCHQFHQLNWCTIFRTLVKFVLSTYAFFVQNIFFSSNFWLFMVKICWLNDNCLGQGSPPLYWPQIGGNMNYFSLRKSGKKTS